MKPWKRIDPTIVAKIDRRTVTLKTFIDNRGDQQVFALLHPDGQEFVAVIAGTTDKKVLIARQFRPGPEKVMDELPGGFVDKGEAPETALRRELLEETGYVPGELTYLGAYYKDAYMNAKWHVFLAVDCTRQTTKQVLDDSEDVHIDLISIQQLLDNARHDNMTDTTAVLYAYETLKKMEDA